MEKLQIMVEDYVMDLKKRVNPNSVPTYLYAVQAFLESNDIELRWRKIRRLYPAKVKISGTKPYTNKQIQTLLEYTLSLRNKAIIHFLASSGVRVGALADLKIKHIQSMPMECKAVTIYEESKEEYVTFLTPEASKALDSYIEQRRADKEYLDDESPLFRTTYKIGFLQAKPMSRRAIINVVERIVNRTGIRTKKTGKRYETQLDHGFRKRFDTIMELNSQVKESISEKLMGHSDGTRGRYVNPTIEKLFEEFKKVIPELTIDDSARNQIQLEQKQKENTDLQKKVSEIEELKQQRKQDKIDSERKLKEMFEEWTNAIFSKKPNF